MSTPHLYAELAKYEEKLERFVEQVEPLRARVAQVASEDAVSPALLRTFDEEFGRLEQTFRSLKKMAQADAAKGVNRTEDELVSAYRVLSVALFRTERTAQALHRELERLQVDALAFNQKLAAATSTAKSR